MDITNLTLEQLQALGYRLIQQYESAMIPVQKIKQNLDIVNAKIQKKMQEKAGEEETKTDTVAEPLKEEVKTEPLKDENV